MIDLTTINGTPRMIQKFDKFIDSVTERMGVYVDRVLKSDEASSPPLKFIKAMLVMSLDEPNFLTDELFDVYTEDILSIAASTSGIFDSTKSGTVTRKNIFIKGDTREYMIPTSGIIGSKVTIFDGWDEWKDIQPICLVACNSNELNVDQRSSQLVYVTDKPSSATFTIDTAALLMKYLVYLRHHKISYTNEIMDQFVLNHVLKYLYTDMIDVWISRLLLGVLDNEDVVQYPISSQLSTSEYASAIGDVRELVDRYAKGKIELGDFINTFWYDGFSLVEVYNKYRNTYYTYSSNRYIGATLLKSSTITAILLELLQITISRKKNTQLIKRIIVSVSILGRSKWKKHVKDPRMQDEIELLILRANTLGL